MEALLRDLRDQVVLSVSQQVLKVPDCAEYAPSHEGGIIYYFQNWKLYQSISASRTSDSKNQMSVELLEWWIWLE